MKSKTLIRTLVAAVVIAALIPVGFLGKLWLDARSLKRKLAELQAAGEPVVVADFKSLLSQSIDGEDNAAEILKQAGLELAAFNGDLNVVYSSDGFSVGNLSDAELDAIEAALERSPNLIPLLRQAAQCSGYDPKWNFEASPQMFLSDSGARVQSSRLATRALQAHAYWQLANGEPEEALASCLAIFQISKHVSREPSLISYLVSVATRSVGVEVANRILRSSTLPPSAHDALDAELARQDEVEAYRWSIRSERVFGLDNFQMFRMGPIPLYSALDQIQYLDLMGQEIESASQPYVTVVMDEQSREQYEASVRRMTGMVLPAVEQARIAKERLEARVRCLRILNALYRAGATVPGSETDVTDSPDLSALNLPSEVLTDPFTGKPLQVKRAPKGWLIYSVGENQQDDGGQFEKALDVGVGPISVDEAH